MYLYFDDKGKLHGTSTIENCSFEKDGKIYKSPIEYNDYIWGQDYQLKDGQIINLGKIKQPKPE